MDVRTFRARTMPEALRRVRRELGPDASVLHTREVGQGIWTWLTGRKEVEVTASTSVVVPSRFDKPARRATTPIHDAPTMKVESRTSMRHDSLDHSPVSTSIAASFSAGAAASSPAFAAASTSSFESLESQGLLASQPADVAVMPEPRSIVEDLSRTRRDGSGDLSDSLFRLFADLIDAEVQEETARELVDRVRAGMAGHEPGEMTQLWSRVTRFVEEEIRIAGPIEVVPGVCRVVAMVGPTGVGKTTTIAKLAANQRLREHRRVGLITVDTYRIAAVEQLRTYADIMDLPMEVVATPREMRAAIDRFSDFDLVLMDTAGRSPKDEVRIQELKSLLQEARPHEVHLVLSAVSSAAQMENAAERFAKVGVTSLLLTKLDEATGLGNLLPIMRSSRLPLSYITNGQNVPADIEPADRRNLARAVLGRDGIHA